MPLFTFSRATRRWVTGLILTAGTALALEATPATAQSPGQWRPRQVHPNYCPPSPSQYPHVHPPDLPALPPYELAPPPLELTPSPTEQAPPPTEDGKPSTDSTPPTDPMTDGAPQDSTTDPGAQQDPGQQGMDQQGMDQQGLGQQDAGQQGLGQDAGAAAAQAPATTPASQAASSTGASPNMIGDFFGSGSSTFSEMFSLGGASSGLLPSPSTSVVGRQKIAENTSICPTDRVFVNFNYFDNVPLTRDGVDVVRVTPGFERTLFEGRMSVEARFPFASTLDNNIFLGNSVNDPLTVADDDSIEFGNINLALKGLLYGNCNCGLAISGGCAFTLPTADDLVIRESRPDSAAPLGTELLRVENQAVHVLPFIGALYQPPCSNVFYHGYAQLDFDVNGNTVFADPDAFSGLAPMGLADFGDLNDVTFLYVDVGAGYWLTRNYNRFGRPSGGLALTAELHYSRSLTNANELRAARNLSSVTFGSTDNNIELMNGIIGGLYVAENGSQFLLGVGAPIMGSDDEQFDWELRAAVSIYLGRDTGANVARRVGSAMRPIDRLLDRAL